MLQGVIQCLTAASGFLIVRALDKSEFAAYTVAAALQSIISSLTDSGVGAGVNAIGGRVWANDTKLANLLATSLRLRARMTLVGAPITVFVAYFLLRQAHVDFAKGAALIVLVTVGVWGTFAVSIFSAPLRLRSRYLAAQRIELVASMVRLGLVAALRVTSMNAISAFTATISTVALQGLVLRHRATAMLRSGGAPDPEYHDTLYRLMRRQFPTTLFLAFQSQITVFVISLFGSVDKIADVGALSRLAIVFALIGNVTNGLIVPTYARCDSVRRLVTLFGLSVSIFCAFSLVLIASSCFFPMHVLWVLGTQYSSLNNEVRWLAANASVGGLTGVLYAFVGSRGWIWHSWLIPLLTIAGEAVMLPFVDLSAVRGVLQFGFVALLPALTITAYMALRGIVASWRTGSIAPIAT